jgi:hypothetical protein
MGFNIKEKGSINQVGKKVTGSLHRGKIVRKMGGPDSRRRALTTTAPLFFM